MKAAKKRKAGAPSEKPLRRAVFVDRDGVLNDEVDYLSKVEDLRMIPGAAAAVKRLREAGFKVIVISNQSGVARGYFTQDALREITDRLVVELENEGTKLDAIYYCCHGPDEGCECRKPGVQLLEQAKKRFSLDMDASYFVGDTTTDVATALKAGCRAVLVRTGKGGKDGKYSDAEPDFVADDLSEAAAWIIEEAEARAGADADNV